MEKPKKPIVAAILNFLFPGAGFVYIMKPNYLLISGLIIILSTIFSTIIFFTQESVNTSNGESADAFIQSANTFSTLSTSSLELSSSIEDENIQKYLVENSKTLELASDQLSTASNIIKQSQFGGVSIITSLILSFGMAFLAFSIVKQNNSSIS